MRPFIRRGGYVVTALALFLYGLELIKTGARGVMPFLDLLDVSGAVNTFGLGWIVSMAVLSGSPVAAIAMSLFGAHEIDAIEAMAMVAGSRFGAAFVVLLIGTIQLLRDRKAFSGVSIGVLCLLVTWSIMAPAVVVSWLLLWTGALSGVRVPLPATVSGIFEAVTGPVVGPLAARLPGAVLFVAGVVLLIASFALFDRALPALDPKHSRFRQIAFVIYRPAIMFVLGAVVTTLTLSVSVSLGLLVPLSTKGYVRRENVIPYIMGANVTTFLDTLAAAILVNEPAAFSVVLALMIGVVIFSLVVILGFYRSYRDGLEWSLRWITIDRRSFILFAAVMMGLPLVMVLI